MRSLLRRLVGFALLPAFSLVASVFLLPLVSGSEGEPGLVALGVGQSIGAILSVVGALAWPSIGGHAVAVATPAERRAILARSMYSRIAMLAALLPVGVVACVLLVDFQQLATCLFMVGIALNAMTCSWYYAGLGAPRRLVVNEGIVRLAAYVLAAVALTLGAPLYVYAGLTVGAGLTSLTLNWGQNLPGARLWYRGALVDAVRTVAEHRLGTGSRVLQSVFTFGGPTVFGSVSPGNVGTFVALDQSQKTSLNAVAVLPEAFQAWVSSDLTHHARRSRLAMTATSVTAGLVVIAWSLLGPLVIDVLFAGVIRADHLACTVLGGAIAMTLVAKTYELLVMIPLGLQQVVFRVEAAFSVLGLGVLAAASATGVPFLAIGSWAVMNAAILVTLWVRRRGLARKHR